jgi:hypothetical protein
MNEIIRNAKLFQHLRAHACRGVVIIRLAAVAILWSAGRKDALV